jgi:PEP-CTERM motif
LAEHSIRWNRGWHHCSSTVGSSGCFTERLAQVRYSRWIPLLALIVIPASCFATQIVIGRGTHSQPINSTTFGIQSPSGTSPGTSPCYLGNIEVPDCDFVNESGSNWTNIFIAFNPVQPGNDLSCSGGPWFSNCQFQFDQNGDATSVLFFNSPHAGGCNPPTSDYCGIPNGSQGDFVFDVTGFTAPTDFDAQADAPEPSSLVLLSLGLLGVGLWRCRRRRACI